MTLQVHAYVTKSSTGTLVTLENRFWDESIMIGDDSAARSMYFLAAGFACQITVPLQNGV